MDASVVREAIVALANKSFLIVNHQVSPPEYRLLETVRAYAAMKLQRLAWISARIVRARTRNGTCVLSPTLDSRSTIASRAADRRPTCKLKLGEADSSFAFIEIEIVQLAELDCSSE